MLLYVTDFDAVEVEPPFALNVTVYVFAVQCAYRVRVDAFDTVLDDVIFVPPDAAVYQPLKV